MTRPPAGLAFELPGGDVFATPVPAAGTDPVPTVFLHPGQLFVARTPTVITMVLGSCVSVCLWDHRARVGGANHYLLPSDVGVVPAVTRFGPGAIRTLVHLLLRAGAQRRSLSARIFGGANVLDAFRGTAHHLGLANVETARASLRDHGISVDAEDIGGTRGRHLQFSTADGAAVVRLI